MEDTDLTAAVLAEVRYRDPKELRRIGTVDHPWTLVAAAAVGFRTYDQPLAAGYCMSSQSSAADSHTSDQPWAA